MARISIIIPVYGVEKYIEKCARSLFEQTYNDLEYIFVDDCTKDESISILQRVLLDYPDRQSQVKILHNEKNSGQSATRKKGILASTGDYLIHCDSDDWVDHDFYESIAKKADATDADIICCDYTAEFKNRHKDFIYDDYTHPHDRIRSKVQRMWSLCWCAVKSSLIRTYNILPPENINMTEDMHMLMRTHYFAESIANVHGPKYHYVCERENSISNIAKTSKDLLCVQRRSLLQIEDFFKSQNFDPGDGILVLKQAVRDNFLGIDEYEEWASTFPETITFTTSDLTLPKAYRISYLLGSKGYFFVLRLYRWLSYLKS